GSARNARGPAAAATHYEASRARTSGSTRFDLPVACRPRRGAARSQADGLTQQSIALLSAFVHARAGAHRRDGIRTRPCAAIPNQRSAPHPVRYAGRQRRFRADASADAVLAACEAARAAGVRISFAHGTLCERSRSAFYDGLRRRRPVAADAARTTLIQAEAGCVRAR